MQDIRIPGMLHGRVVRAPLYRAELVALDDAKVAAMPGVVAVVRDGSFLGVVAEREEQAVGARAALAEAAQWRTAATLPEEDGIYDHLLALKDMAVVVGERSLAAKPAERTLEARYTRPYQAHASIGPSAALAEFTDGGLSVCSASTVGPPSSR